MPEGTLLAKGKTKEIRETDAPRIVEIYSTDDITAGNGAKHDILPGKGELATETTVNAFAFLKERDIPVAYICRTGPRTFWAFQCDMIKLEVVIRREAAGSYFKRNPSAVAGTRFKNPVVEYYLKTSGEVWKGSGVIEHALPADDPFLSLDFVRGGFGVHYPSLPIDNTHPLFFVSFKDVGLKDSDISRIETLATRVFVYLEQIWWFAAKGTLKDLKIEFGWCNDGTRADPRGILVVADVIDNDSWRLEIGGKEVSKETYRKGMPLPLVSTFYHQVAQYSKRFKEQYA